MPAPDPGFGAIALGLVNTLLTAALIFFMNSRDRAAAQQRLEAMGAMSEITKDLKKLNDLVLGGYARREELESMQREMNKQEELRRKTSHIFRGELHRFHLALVAHNIKVPPASLPSEEELMEGNK